MSQPRSSAKKPLSASRSDPLADLRHRHDGWTPERQHDFIRALAESGCVTEACAAVGLSPSSAYRLRALPAATAFRQAWDVALDYANRRLSDAAFSRALHGVARPVFYQGEQVGERRYYDERLTQFLLRYRDPVRYGRWVDGYEARRHPDGAGTTLAHALNVVTDAAHGVVAVEEEDGDEREESGGVRMPAALDRGPPPPVEEDPFALPADDPFASPEYDLFASPDPFASPADEPGDPMPIDPQENAAALLAAIKARTALVEARRAAAQRPEDSGAATAEEDWGSPLIVRRPAQARPRTRRRPAVPGVT